MRVNLPEVYYELLKEFCVGYAQMLKAKGEKQKERNALCAYFSYLEAHAQGKINSFWIRETPTTEYYKCGDCRWESELPTKYCPACGRTKTGIKIYPDSSHEGNITIEELPDMKELLRSNSRSCN